jgi:hypothetical protein
MTWITIPIIIICINLYGAIHWGWPERTKGYQEGIKKSNGLPITSQIEGHIFSPLAFVITEHRILVYDKDEKVYALDGIKLDKDLTPETLTVGSNISYTVFTKAGQLYFGRVRS